MIAGVPRPPLRMSAPRGAPMKKNMRQAIERANFFRISMSMSLRVKLCLYLSLAYDSKDIWRSNAAFFAFSSAVISRCRSSHTPTFSTLKMLVGIFLFDVSSWLLYLMSLEVLRASRLSFLPFASSAPIESWPCCSCLRFIDLTWSSNLELSDFWNA